MIVDRTHHNNSSRLALIFAGWGMDAHPFVNVARQGYDTAIAYNYACQGDLPQWIYDYDEICLFAWSYGVCMAERVMAKHTDLPVTLKVAINGTPKPVDDNSGIPHSLYRATLDALSERSVAKFYRRICRDSNTFNAFKDIMPQRSIESLRDELALFDNLEPCAPAVWDIVYISDYDAIIPPQNQHNAWQTCRDVRLMTDGHLPDFNQILIECLIDKSDVEQKFNSSSASYDSNAVIQHKMCARMADCILGHNDSPETMIEVGPGTGTLTKMYAPHLKSTRLELWDLTEIDMSLPGKHLQCDAETQILSLSLESVDIISGSATIQWMNSPMQFVAKAAACIKPGGMAVFSTFGPDTFREIAALLPSPLHYISAEDWRKINIPDCEITVCEECEVLRFDSPRTLLKHISSTGANGCGNTAGASQSACRRILNSGIDLLTYHCIYIKIVKHIS